MQYSLAPTDSKGRRPYDVYKDESETPQEKCP